MAIPDQDIQYFQEKLLQWFGTNARSFPWRRKNLTQYQIIIAEVLLQRTKAETVAKFYPLFIQAYPSWQALATAGIEEIGEYLRPVGLYQQRAKRLHALAVEMLRRRGRLPRKREELEKIPFLGQYIANSIELIIFKQPSPLLDVNMARVLERFFGYREKADIRYDPYLQELSKKVVNIPTSKELSWAILDFAALICKAPTPLCDRCLLNTKCLYFRTHK